MTYHPITPPPELLKSWEDRHFDEEENVDLLLIEAYQAGADQELDACCEYLRRCAAWEPEDVDEFCAARRLKPLSLKKQALDALGRFSSNAHTQASQMTQDFEVLRRAVEQLND